MNRLNVLICVYVSDGRSVLEMWHYKGGNLCPILSFFVFILYMFCLSDSKICLLFMCSCHLYDNFLDMIYMFLEMSSITV